MGNDWFKPTEDELKLFKKISELLCGLPSIRDVTLCSTGIHDSGIVGFFFGDTRYYLEAKDGLVFLHVSKIPEEIRAHFKAKYPFSCFTQKNSCCCWEGIQL
jgi:hypothetical protein